MHIAISVKDFRAIVLHAETLRTSVQASYSFPTRPMQLAYSERGMQCEFTLMTIGDYRGSSTPAPVTAGKSPSLPRDVLSMRQASAPPTQGSGDREAHDRDHAAMPPPSQPASRSLAQLPQTPVVPDGLQQKASSQQPSRPFPAPPKGSLDPESLFLPAEASDDREWDEPDVEDDGLTLGWDASANPVSEDPKNTFAMLGAHAFKEIPLRSNQRSLGDSSHDHALSTWAKDADQRIPPTQRLSEVCPIFLETLEMMAHQRYRSIHYSVNDRLHPR